MKSIELINKERENQLSHDYDAAHDDQHNDGCLADLAAFIACNDPDTEIALPVWAYEYAGHIAKKWKDDRVHQLVIAAALLVAEIERLQRESSPSATARSS